MTPATASNAAATPAAAGAGASTAETCAEPDPAADSAAMELVTGTEAADRTGAVASALSSQEIKTEAPPSALSLEDAKVYTVTSSDTTVTSVTVPIGERYSMLSNLTVIFDTDGNIVQSSESLLSENSAGNFNVSTFNNGELVNSDDTDRPFMTDAEMQNSDGTTAEVSTLGAGSTAACVATVLGVSGAVAVAIVSLCGGSCTIPIAGTAICVACIGAYATFGGASVQQVASCF